MFKKFEDDFLNMETSKYALFVEGDGGEGGGGTPLTTESMKEFMDGLKEFGGELKTLNNNVKAAQGRQTAVEDTTNNNNEDNDTPQEVDFESMTRKEFAEFIQQSMLTATEKHVLAPLVDRLNSIESGLTTKEFSSEIDILSSKHKDFWEFREEMKELATRHPSMRPKEVYLLARATHPDKAKELDTRFAPVTQSPAKRPAFGGFAPGGAGSKGSPSKAMSTTAALDDAWEQTVAKHGNILSSLEN